MKYVLICVCLILSLISKSVFAKEHFPVKGEIKTRVNFWKKVYTDISTQEAFIHDSENLSIIYDTIKLPKNRKKKNKFLKRKKRELKKIIHSIARKNYINLNKQEEHIANKIGELSNRSLKKLAKNIRIQSGLRDRYYEGLKRSYLYLDYIKRTFRRYGIPQELVYLPHVESSFNYNAYSKVGAAGIWQFMRSTARIYKLKVSYIIDERRDPLKATIAAAKLLKDNYRLLKSWPLALTAYNHGPRSMLRAKKQFKTDDMNIIINNYKGRRFGFASKNFYATFMATVQISQNPQKYFKAFKPPKKFQYSTLKLTKPLTLQNLTKDLKLSLSEIKKYNPSIRKIAYRGPFFLPKNYELKIASRSKKNLNKITSSIKKLKIDESLLTTQKLHIVSRGESLYDISRYYKTTVNHLIIFNQINNPSRIYPGMKIKIPGKKDQIPKKTITLVTKTKNLKQPSITEEKNPNHYRINKKAGKQASLVKAKSGTKSISASLLNNTINKQPSPLINLSSYTLDLKPISRDIYKLTIETEETLGHYADWGNININSIRKLNRLARTSAIVRGKVIKIQIPENRLLKFKELRNEYHLSIQEDFYSNFSSTENTQYIVKRGDNINSILQKFNLPFWLLRKTQKEGKLHDKLYIRQKIIIPIISKINESNK